MIMNYINGVRKQKNLCQSLSLLDGRDEDITKLYYDLGIQSNNVFTKEYLDMKDTTVSDLIRMEGGAEKVLIVKIHQSENKEYQWATAVCI